MDIEAALDWVNATVEASTGTGLRDPETVILRGTWQGFTYEQMARNSDYSVNYLMRDVAPKFWRRLSGILGQSVGKTNFRVVLESLTAGEERSATLLARGSANTLKEPVSTTSRVISQPGALVSPPPPTLCGYDDELAQLIEWLTQASRPESELSYPTEEPGRLISIQGLPGIGKFRLCEAAIAQVAHRFDGVLWQTFDSNLQLDDFCLSILAGLGIEVPSEQAPTTLLAELSRRSVLLALKGIEAILQSGQLTGQFAPDQADYAEFFQAALGLRSSCLLVTGIEEPATWVNRSREDGPLRSLRLSRLSESAATELLKQADLQNPDHWPTLIERYQAHPSALLAAARIIREIFDGRVDSFLQQTDTPLYKIIRLVEASFSRLSPAEQSVVDWLATQESGLSLRELQQTLPSSPRNAELISQLDSLKQRSLLTIESTHDLPIFSLPPLVQAYARHQLLSQFTRNHIQVSEPLSPASLRSSLVSSSQILSLSSPQASATRLSQWLEGRFSSHWQPLAQLLVNPQCQAMRLRSTYPFRFETFIKRYKSIVMESAAEPDNRRTQTARATDREEAETPKVEVVLLVAIQAGFEDTYQICIQVQPASAASSLPEQLVIRLFDPQHRCIASVSNQEADTFMQLPCFFGHETETFDVELSMANLSHSEAFII